MPRPRLLLRRLLRLLPLVVASAAAAGGRGALEWMCLERCGSDAGAIAGQLQQAARLAAGGALTAVSFEAFNLGPGSTLVTLVYSIQFTLFVSFHIFILHLF